MKFSKSLLDEIRDKIEISDVVGKRVALQKRGKEYVGLSPFQNEKTPSFTVNNEKQFYHCFSSNKHGDIFTFLVEVEGFSFPQAVEKLADRVSVHQKNDLNVTKVKINWIKKNTIGKAFDFYKSLRETYDAIYHHVGIYSFRYETLKKFVSLAPSINELNHKLEQWRALDAKMTIGVSYVKDVPISVDTKKDLINVENIIKNKL